MQVYISVQWIVIGLKLTFCGWFVYGCLVSYFFLSRNAATPITAKVTTTAITIMKGENGGSSGGGVGVEVGSGEGDGEEVGSGLGEGEGLGEGLGVGEGVGDGLGDGSGS